MQVNAGGPPVVVGVDGSQRALGAVTWGTREAVRWNAPLFLIYAYDVPESGPRPRPSASDWIAARKQAADRLLRESMSVAERVRPRPDITAESVVDSPIPLLLNRSHTAKMVVLGSRGHNAFGDLLVGSTATALAAHGHCPVAVIRGSDATGRAKAPVVAGVDGSALSETALDRLLAWSRTAQLMVAGSRGRGGFQGLLLGSTSHALIHYADCPVLIARSPLPAPRD